MLGGHNVSAQNRFSNNTSITMKFSEISDNNYSTTKQNPPFFHVDVHNNILTYTFS